MEMESNKSKSDDKMTGIIILNWNGWRDTIDCLKSLYKIENSEFFIVLADNGSTDESIEKISTFLDTQSNVDHYILNEDEELKNWSNEKKLLNKTTIIYKLRENYGFAKGNNRALNLAQKFQCKYLMLLNNDTEVEPDFLSKLIQFMNHHPHYTALCPKISLFFDKSLIWNCGGKIWWGLRKYHYAGKPEKTIREREYIEATYVTGCAFFFRKELIEQHPLLTEKFFHGEEDFELAYRFKKLGYRMACVLGSHIYHKVGKATQQLNSIGKMYAHYLNRFINMRQQMHPMSYALWRKVYKVYIVRLLKKRGVSPQDRKRFLKKLYQESLILDGVSREKFFEILRNGV